MTEHSDLSNLDHFYGRILKIIPYLSAFQVSELGTALPERKLLYVSFHKITPKTLKRLPYIIICHLHNFHRDLLY